MASLELASNIVEYGPKAVVVAVPWLFVRWRNSRTRPILWLQRTGRILTISTNENSAISDLSLRLSTSDEQFSQAAVEVLDKDFTKAAISRPHLREARIHLERFSKHDTLDVNFDGRVDVEVLGSDAVPLPGPPQKRVRNVDYVILLLSVTTLFALAADPLVRFFFPGPLQTTQGTSNEAFAGFLISVAASFALIAVYIGVALVVVPGRKRLFFGKRVLSIER